MGVTLWQVSQLAEEERHIPLLTCLDDHQVVFTSIIAAIVERRHELGLSQRKFATTLGESNNFVWRIEAGERRVDVVEFYKIARALEADSLELFARILRR